MEQWHDCPSEEDNRPANKTICRSLLAGDDMPWVELRHDCEWDLRPAHSPDTGVVRVTSTGTRDEGDSGGEIFPYSAADGGDEQRIPSSSGGASRFVPSPHNAVTDGNSDLCDVWHDCLEPSSYSLSRASNDLSQQFDSTGYDRDRNSFSCSAQCNEDIWYDCLTGNDEIWGAIRMASGTDNNLQLTEYLPGNVSSASPRSVASSVESTVLPPDPFDNRDRFLTLTGKALPDQLVDLLNKGPNFALSRKVDKHVLKEVELGIERGAFAIRWKEHLDKRKSRSDSHQTCSGDSQTSDVTHSPCNAGRGDGQDESADQGQTDAHQDPEQVTIKLTPRFSDTDTAAAPTAEVSTEKTLKVLKQRVMTIYKNHKPHSQPNHCPDDIRQLKSLGKDPNVVVKRSDKCKGLVILPKTDYVDKAQEITKGYETITKNPTPKLEAQTKKN